MKSTTQRVRILIVGWYGYGNAGDEAILASMVEDLQAEIPGVRISVLSGVPEHTRAVHRLPAVPHLPYHWLDMKASFRSGRILTTLQAIARADLVILGGGGFLSDWQPEAIPTWLLRALAAKVLCGKVMLYAVGAGPITTPRGKLYTRMLINLTDVATVRDQASLEWLRASGVRRPIEVAADPAIGWRGGEKVPPPIPRPGRPSQPVVAVSVAPLFHNPRLWPGKGYRFDEYRNDLATLTRRLVSQLGSHVVFTCMQPSYDAPFAQEVLELADVGQSASLMALEGLTPAQTQAFLAQMDLVIGLRLHALILAASMGVPVVAIPYHHKVQQFMEMVCLPELASPGIGDGHNWVDTDLQLDRLWDCVTQAWERREQVGDHLLTTTQWLRHRARVSARIAADLLR